jgi:adenylate cyclase
VNLAARLEPLNKEYGTTILVSEAVQQRVAEQFVFQAVNTIKPRGFEAAVQIFELRGMATHLSRLTLSLLDE